MMNVRDGYLPPAARVGAIPESLAPRSPDVFAEHGSGLHIHGAEDAVEIDD
jgi:hypothetical protein